MILERVRGLTLGGETHDGEPEADGSGSPKIPVTVVFTSIEGTLAALNAAARLSKDLAAQVVVLATEVVSLRYLYQGLSDSMNFYQRLCEAMVKEAQLQDVAIEVHLCRRQVDCLEARLRPRSIVLIGARKCWWPWRERQLERALRGRGFEALLVYSRSDQSRTRSGVVVQRMLEEARQISG
ncbi:MAG TPA: hypothetical protein VGD64_14025 [Acidisarcina sp.]